LRFAKTTINAIGSMTGIKSRAINNTVLKTPKGLRSAVVVMAMFEDLQCGQMRPGGVAGAGDDGRYCGDGY
jgi:hypothetical protein